MQGGKPISDLQGIADRVEIQPPRSPFTDAALIPHPPRRPDWFS